MNRVVPTLLRQMVPNIGTLILVGLMLFAYRASAAPALQGATPAVINYQGTLTDAAGQPVNGNVDITFRLYSVPEGGTALWQEARTGVNAVPVNGGQFGVLLGSLTPMIRNIWNTGDHFIGVQVGSDPEMMPREIIGAVPTALTVVASSIVTESIVDGAVTGAKLAPASVTAAHIVDGAVTQAEAPSLLQSLDGAGYRVQSGVISKYTAGATAERIDVTFPVPFSETPTVIISDCTLSDQQNWNGVEWKVYGELRSRTGFSAYYRLPALSRGTYKACWIAVGR